MKLQDLLQITNAIKSMNNSELNAVVEAVNQAKRRQSVFSSANFSVGQKVRFGRTPSGLQRVGVIQKMNPAKAVVQVYDNSKKRVQDWRVPYSLMKGVA